MLFIYFDSERWKLFWDRLHQLYSCLTVTSVANHLRGKQRQSTMERIIDLVIVMAKNLEWSLKSSKFCYSL